MLLSVRCLLPWWLQNKGYTPKAVYLHKTSAEGWKGWCWGGDFCLRSHCSWSCAGGWSWQLPHHAARALGLIAFSFFPQPSKPPPVLPAEVLIYARKPEGSILEVSACFQIQPVLISCTVGRLAVPRQEQDRRLHRPEASSCSSGSHKKSPCTCILNRSKQKTPQLPSRYNDVSMIN